MIQNCTPVDFFGAPPDPNTPAGQAALAALAAISPVVVDRQSQALKNIAVNFAGDAFELPAGMVQTAIGLEWREESLQFSPDFLSQINTSTFTCLISSEACTSPTSGSVETKELYGEALVPLLADAPGAQRLDMTLGVRWSDYDTFGSTTNYKVGLEWKPIDALLVRGTYATVFRAPRITDLFSGQSASSDGFNDPCNGFTGPANPACTNVPTNGEFNQTDSQLSAFRGGNPFLVPEEGEVFTLGAVVDLTDMVEGLTTTVDYFDVDLEKTIGTFGTQNILDACFASTIANPSEFCALFSRDANGEIFRLFDVNQNVGTTETRGVDIGVKYAFETGYGNFRTSLDSTYIDEYVRNGIERAGTFLSPANGGQGNYSRWRGLGNIAWNLGNWDASWTQRYVGHFTIDDADAVIPDVVLATGSYTYHNMQAGYNFADWNTRVQMGIDNVFDKQPPLLYQNNTLNGNTDERTFDTVGRYFWMNVTYTF